MNMTKSMIYVVDDDQSVREAVTSLLRSAGLSVSAFHSAQKVWPVVSEKAPACMVLDVEMPGISGLELQQKFIEARFQFPIIFLTGRADIPMSVRAMKAGAFEFLTKPFGDDALLTAVQKAVGTAMTTQSQLLRPRAEKRASFDGIVGKSMALQSVLQRLSKVAETESTILITGETGTGKELLARAAHHASKRASGPFIAVNCGAIPQSLVNSELFGHEKGAFTGALNRRLGRFESANGGTIFLDEVGELPAETQVALLRVLQEREFERVGGTEVIRLDVRVIAATHRDLDSEILAGKFRSDLFYRLNVFPLKVPSLRERKEDISILADYLLKRFAEQTGKKAKSIDKASLESLEAYHWPGNIRELQNVIERSVITCEDEILTVDMSSLAADKSQSLRKTGSLATSIAGQEKLMIENALRECRGRVSGPWGAAAKLGIPDSTLDSKIHALKIDKHRFKLEELATV